MIKIYWRARTVFTPWFMLTWFNGRLHLFRGRRIK